MDTTTLIQKIKSMGLDPASISLDNLDDQELEDMVADLGLRASSGDTLAQDFHVALMDAINAFDRG